MVGSYEYALDIFGQQPGLQNLYTQISLIYGVPNIKERAWEGTEDPLVSTIHLRLTNALQKLTHSVPWIAGQVVRTPNAQKKGDSYKIVPLDDIDIPHLSVKDLRHGCSKHSNLTMKALRDANFPFSMLDENVIAPRNTLMATGDVVPVFMVQATILPSGGNGLGDNEDEGLILTFVGLHNVMDMTGLGWIIGILDKLSKGGDLTPQEKHLANMDRANIIKLFDFEFHAEAEANADSENKKASEEGGPGLAEVPECHWAYIAFPSTSLSEMKSIAQGSAPYHDHTRGDDEDRTIPPFISTDDVLSAFIFQSIIRARRPRLPTDASVTFARAIDPRRFLGIDTSYPGVVQCMTYHSYTLPEITDMPLGYLAANLRHALRPSEYTTAVPCSLTSSKAEYLIKTQDIEYRTRLLATLISQDTSTSVTSSLDLTRDVMLSSWANQSALWTHDFGLGLGIGTPESVRRPAFVGVESLCYIMPRRASDSGGLGDAVVGVCLRNDDMERLREDGRMKSWGRWIG